jgi:hypothetical protein
MGRADDRGARLGIMQPCIFCGRIDGCPSKEHPTPKRARDAFSIPLEPHTHWERVSELVDATVREPQAQGLTGDRCTGDDWLFIAGRWTFPLCWVELVEIAVTQADLVERRQRRIDQYDASLWVDRVGL